MSTLRTHHVTTTDGVTIGATVQGQGPPLVFLQGVIGDGDLDWQALVPLLAERFTCHMPSMRGRGLSGDHPDLSIGRVRDDYLDYVDSIGEPTGLVGWSAGAIHACAVAAESETVRATASFEPPANMVTDEDERAALGAALARAGELAAVGDLPAAVRVVARHLLTDDEMAVAEAAGYLDAAGRYVPNMLEVFRQFPEYDGVMPEDPSVLGAISSPVLVLHGTETSAHFTTCARYVTDHVPDARRHQIPGAGHAAPLTHPEALAGVLTEFFSSAGLTARSAATHA